MSEQKKICVVCDLMMVPTCLYPIGALAFLLVSSVASLAAWAPFNIQAPTPGPNPTVVHATLAFSVAERDVIPEGICYDPVERVFYIGSIHKRKILKVSASGLASDFTTSAEDGLFEVLGLKVDAARRILWACSAAEASIKGFDGYSGIFKFDLRTGKLIKKYVLDNKSGKHLFNDITISKSGDVYFTDSLDGGVYTIEHVADEIGQFVKPGTYSYPNGIALSPDDKVLFVADDKGICRVTVSSGESRGLRHPAEIEIKGLDGMYFYEGSLVGVQNGIKPLRIVRFYLDGAFNRVERLQTLDVDNPLFRIPTTGTIVGDQFYFLANSNLANLKDDGSIVNPRQIEGPKVLRAKL